MLRGGIELDSLPADRAQPGGGRRHARSDVVLPPGAAAARRCWPTRCAALRRDGRGRRPAKLGGAALDGGRGRARLPRSTPPTGVDGRRGAKGGRDRSRSVGGTNGGSRSWARSATTRRSSASSAPCSGIIRAFHDLAGSSLQGTQAVMSGIAEALVATGVGLLVALPAVAAYNIFTRQVERTRARLRGARPRDPRAAEGRPTAPSGDPRLRPPLPWSKPDGLGDAQARHHRRDQRHAAGRHHAGAC